MDVVSPHPRRAENREAEEAEALGLRFKSSIPKPYRWRDWAAPGLAHASGQKRAAFGNFVHEDLLPKLKNLENQPGAERAAKSHQRNHVQRGSQPD